MRRRKADAPISVVDSATAQLSGRLTLDAVQV